MEPNPKLTVRLVVKHVVASAVGIAAGTLVAKTADNHTGFEKDDIVVKLVAGAVALVVSTKAQPHTDKAVDFAADYIVAKREARRAQKDNTKKTEK